jgi:hypothetical protein
MHNLTNVHRTKSEMGVFSDYPHYYRVEKEGKKDQILFSERASENGNFIISRTANVFCQYGPNYMGVLEANMLGTEFKLYDWGVLSKKELVGLPKGFMSVRRHIATISYDSNFFAEKPRSFRVHFIDYQNSAKSKQTEIDCSFENV